MKENLVRLLIFFAVTSYLDNLEMLKTKKPAQSGGFLTHQFYFNKTISFVSKILPALNSYQYAPALTGLPSLFHIYRC
jgi:hypothetical protein